jgi:hypothetical protein
MHFHRNSHPNCPLKFNIPVYRSARGAGGLNALHLRSVGQSRKLAMLFLLTPAILLSQAQSLASDIQHFDDA